MTVSRARGKLEAALAQFGLRGRVDGARAIDVGASTGGFTEALLASGAAQVLAVDVGHGQLHPSLRGDPRVVSLEGVDWKRLSLDVAEGPFDFFTVDVSFVAARNMLRGLAFRLRAGAEGVVLVKPQFELPDRPGQGRYVDDADRRREALEKVRRKAETLGFSLVAHADSPVTGAGGTVEALAHLRFAGRPERLPRPGERRRDAIGAPAPRGRPAPGASPHADPPLRWFAVVSPGLEEVTLREVAALPGITGVEQVPGGVEWTGPAASGYRANLWLRVATRVLARVGAVDAREFGQLRRRAAKLPWRTFVADGSVIAVRASASRCRLYHTGGLAENVALAIADAVPGARLAASEQQEGHEDGQEEGHEDGREEETKETAAVSILVRGSEDRFTLSVDASGERLHRRGARVEIGAAPLRETLAAGLLALAGWQPTVALVDPMCGAGTIVIEAGTQALGLAPGLARRFAMESWPLCAAPARAAALAALRAEAEAPADVPADVPQPLPLILGSDRDPAVIESAQRNAARAGVESRIAFSCRDLGDARPHAPTGLILTNPPYGRRLGNPRAAARGYRDLGRVLRAHFRGWSAAVVVPAGLDAAAALGRPARARFALRNGGLPIALYVFELG